MFNEVSAYSARQPTAFYKPFFFTVKLLTTIKDVPNSAIFRTAQTRVKEKSLFQRIQLCGMEEGPADLKALDPTSPVPYTFYQYT
jgi:hypothetical protein